MGQGLVFGALGRTCAHVCVDMQRLFAEGSEWATPWIVRVLPQVERLVEADPRRTVFTRFVPPHRAAQREGCWRRYWERWETLTLERADPALVELLPSLARHAPPALVVDKQVYSPWLTDDLGAALRDLRADTVVVTGGETDVCVLATVLGALDRGYRVVVASDGLCSSSDATHDSSLSLYADRFSQHIEVATTAEILDAWR